MYIESQKALNAFCSPQHRPISKRESIYIDRSDPLKIPYDKLELAGYSWGSGPVIVLVHGWEARGTSLAAFIEPLVQKGFRVVTFDGPAHGNSPGTQTNLVDFGQATRSVIKHVGPVYGIVSHSFGAASVVFMLAEETPVDVRKLVLIACPSDLKDVIQRFAIDTGLSSSVTQEMFELIQTQLGKPVDLFSGRRVAPSLTIPTLVIHDQQDREVPFSDALAMTSRWLQASLLTTNGRGHRRILWDTKVIKEVITFLTQISDTPTTENCL